MFGKILEWNYLDLEIFEEGEIFNDKFNIISYRAIHIGDFILGEL